MTLEFCSECNEATGRAGRHEDSIYIEYPDKEVGPLCDTCRETHWVCEECGLGVYPAHVNFDETHEYCGGDCS